MSCTGTSKVANYAPSSFEQGPLMRPLAGGNVLIAQDGSAKLADFGFSQLLTAASRSQCSTSNGTTRWMAPELLEDDQSQHTVLSDIWACGCLFIEVASHTSQCAWLMDIRRFSAMFYRSTRLKRTRKLFLLFRDMRSLRVHRASPTVSGLLSSSVADRSTPTGYP